MDTTQLKNNLSNSNETQELEQKDTQEFNAENIWQNCWIYSKRVFGERIKFTTCVYVYEENGELRLRLEATNAPTQVFILSDFERQVDFKILGVGITLKISIYGLVVNPNNIRFNIRLEVRFCLPSVCTGWFTIVDEPVPLERLSVNAKTDHGDYKQGSFISLAPGNILEEENPNLN